MMEKIILNQLAVNLRLRVVKVGQALLPLQTVLFRRRASIKTTAVSGRKIEVDAPAEVKGDKEIAITALKLEKSNVSKELQPPTNKSLCWRQHLLFKSI